MLQTRKPQPTTPTYGLDALHIFPYFPTRVVFEVMTGEKCPPFDPSKPPKYWRDLDALKANLEDGEQMVYDRVAYLPSGGVKRDANGNPVFAKLFISPQDAASVNIPDKTKSVFTNPGVSPNEVQPPLFELFPTERLQFGTSINSAQLIIRRVDVPMGTVPSSSTGFTTEDRATLDAIAKALGVK